MKYRSDEELEDYDYTFEYGQPAVVIAGSQQEERTQPYLEQLRARTVWASTPWRIRRCGDVVVVPAFQHKINSVLIHNAGKVVIAGRGRVARRVLLGDWTYSAMYSVIEF